MIAEILFSMALSGALAAPPAEPPLRGSRQDDAQGSSLRAIVEVTRVEAGAADDKVVALALHIRYRFTSVGDRRITFPCGEPLVYYFRYAASEAALSRAGWDHLGRITAQSRHEYGAKPDSRFVTIEPGVVHAVSGTAWLLVLRRDFPRPAVVQLVVAPLDLPEDIGKRLESTWKPYGTLHLGGVRTEGFSVNLPGDRSQRPCR
jgi:hypothetical protein